MLTEKERDGYGLFSLVVKSKQTNNKIMERMNKTKHFP